MESSASIESFRKQVEARRLKNWIVTARRLSEVPPETTLLAALDLTDFVHKLSRVGG